MFEKRLPFAGLAAVLCVVLAACGSHAARARVTPTVTKVVATPVPLDLAGYASLADPTLKQTLQEGNHLLSQLHHASRSDMETLGNQCSLVGQDLSNYNTSFRSTQVPPGAKSVYHDGTQAFKILLSSTDECGMAADASDSKQLQAVASDMGYALWVLGKVERSVAPWNQSHA